MIALSGLVNCSFTGKATQNVISRGRGFLSFSDCTFSSDLKASPKPLVQIDSGRVQIRSSSFKSDQPSIAIISSIGYAIVTGNNGIKGVKPMFRGAGEDLMTWRNNEAGH